MKRLFKFLPFLSTLALTGCSRGLFDPKGTIATDEKDLFFISIGLMLIVVIPVFVMIFWFARRYRASNKKAHYDPNWSHNTWLEVIWWAVPFIIIAILGVITWVSSHTLSPYRPLVSKTKPITIQVVALNWKWLFIYPKQNIATVNFIQFPTNTPINFEITSAAPMNSFFIPRLGGQIYAMTGMKTQLHLNATEAGNYYGMSANYSGNGFYGMHFIAKASSQKAFNQWVWQVRHTGQALTAHRYHQLAKDSENNPVVYYSSANPNLFKSIMQHYLQPNVIVGKGTPESL